MIRTLREGLKREKGLLKVSLKKVVDTYNEYKHRAIGMKPNEAIKIENRKRVLENIEKYKKEFKELKFKPFKVGDTVLIKNEFKKDKMDKEFKDVGKIIEVDGKNILLKLKIAKILFKNIIYKQEFGQGLLYHHETKYKLFHVDIFKKIFLNK